MCAKSPTGAPIKIRAFQHILISCTFTFSVSWRDNSLHCRRVLLMTPSCCCVHACNTTMYSLSRRHVLLPTQCQVVREVVRCKQTKSTLKEPRRICKRKPLGCAGCQAQTLPGSLCLRWGDVKSKDQDDMMPANGDDDSTRCKSDGDDAATTSCKSHGDGDATT